MRKFLITIALMALPTTAAQATTVGKDTVACRLDKPRVCEKVESGSLIMFSFNEMSKAPRGKATILRDPEGPVRVMDLRAIVDGEDCCMSK